MAEEFMGPFERMKARVEAKRELTESDMLSIRSRARSAMDSEKDPRVADFVNLMRSKDKDGFSEY